MKEKLIALQVLRAVAATLVVIGHSTTFLGASMAAELFFMISGFVMMYATQRGLEQYFTKRIIRLVPLYWIVNIFFALLVNPHGTSVDFFLKSIFFLTTPPLLVIGWTLNCEVRFYVLFWVCAKINLKNRGPIAIAACMFWYVLELKRYSGPRVNPFPFMQPALALGILAFYCYGYLRTKELHTVHKVFLVVLTGLSAVFVHSNFADSLIWDPRRGTWSLIRPVLWGVPVFIIFMSVMLLVRSDSNRLVKPLIYVGNISYSLYLWHIVVQEILVNLLEKIGHPVTLPGPFRFFLLTYTVSLLVASCSYRWIEQPISKFLKDRLKKLQPA